MSLVLGELDIKRCLQTSFSLPAILSFLLFNGPEYPQGSNTRGGVVGPSRRRKEAPFCSRYLVSRFVLFDLWKRGRQASRQTGKGIERRIQGSLIITPLNAFLLAHPS